MTEMYKLSIQMMEEEAEKYLSIGFKKDWGDGYVCSEDLILLRKENPVDRYNTIYTHDYAIISRLFRTVVIKNSTSYYA